MSELLEIGDVVQVNDPGLAALREVMRNAGIEPETNNIGKIVEIWEDTNPVTYLVGFPDGQVSPYPASMVELRDEEEG